MDGQKCKHGDSCTYAHGEVLIYFIQSDLRQPGPAMYPYVSYPMQFYNG